MEGITDAPNGDSIEVALLGGRWDDVRPVLAALSGRGFSFSDPAEEIAGEGEPGLLLLSPGYQYRPLRAPGQPPRSPTLQCIARSPESDELYPEADDVILVPCSESEMAMRIRRLTVEGGAVIAPTSKALEMAGITLNPLTFQVLIDGLPVTLTWMEFHLLKFFMQHSGRVFRREEILQRVWGSRYEGIQRTVDVHIRRLRHKLGGTCRKAAEHGPQRRLRPTAGVRVRPSGVPSSAIGALERLSNARARSPGRASLRIAGR